MREWDFAVIAEAVFVDWQVVFRPIVGVDVIFVGEAELATNVGLFDDWPACAACSSVQGGGIF